VSGSSRGSYYLAVVARLAPGRALEEAMAEVQGLGARISRQFPESATGVGLAVFPLHDATVGDVRPALLVLLGAVGFVLLIACANVANLLLARAASREGEIAVRIALGAGRGRLVRQLLTESVVLALLGAVVGLLLAYWGAHLLVAMQPRGVPRLDAVQVDGTVAAFTFGVALLTGLLFGLVPALQATRNGLAGTLKDGGRGAVGKRGAARMRGGLVVAEMALAVMLLAGAGLLIRSFSLLSRVDPGFQPERVLAFRVSLPEAQYDDDARVEAFFSRLEERLETLPGVSAAGGVMALPLTGTDMQLSFDVEGRPPAQPGQEPVLQVRVATHDYFRALGIPLVRGRMLTAQDRAGALPAVLLSEEAVRRYFPGEDPLGKRITLGWRRGSGSVGGEVVGIVGDVRQLGLDEDFPPEIYLPARQVAMGSLEMVVRTTGDPLALAAAVRREVAALDPNVPVEQVRTMEEIVSQSVSQPRFYMLLLGTFAAVALVLAAVGIFGVMSYAVVQRTREIGIRMALGADPARVLREVVAGGVGLAGVGVAVGTVLALAVTRVLSSLLFGITATDPATYLGAMAVLGGAALVSSYVPARRATRVDPMVALRGE
jgi:putative ABC transport system permease protein